MYLQCERGRRSEAQRSHKPGGVKPDFALRLHAHREKQRSTQEQQATEERGEDLDTDGSTFRGKMPGLRGERKRGLAVLQEIVGHGDDREQEHADQRGGRERGAR